LGGVFAKNTSLETKFPSPFGSGNFSSLDPLILCVIFCGVLFNYFDVGLITYSTEQQQDYQIELF
jgi:hypothetical protein